MLKNESESNTMKCCVFDDRGYHLGDYALAHDAASEVVIQGVRYEIKRWEHDTHALPMDVPHVIVTPIADNTAAHSKYAHITWMSLMDDTPPH